MSEWKCVATLAELRCEGRLVVRHSGKQIALFDTDEGVLACNNRCPHEGYPLSEGTLDSGCVLTCNWHNWKFDLRTGENLLDGDRLRTYPVDVRGDVIWLDLADPPKDARRARALANLEEAFNDNDYARIARELGRLELLGDDLADALALGVRWSHERMRYGWTHAFAAAADWLTLHDEFQDAEARFACVLEALAHMAGDVLREPQHPFTDRRERYDEDKFVASMEREDEASAVAMIRGAVDADAGFAELEPGLTRAALAHYQGFGHALIYTGKAGELVARLGGRAAEPVLTSLVRYVVNARREDLIPEFAAYTPAIASWGSGTEPPDHRAFAGLGTTKALERAAASSAADPLAQHAALLGANAANLLAFDMRHQDEVRTQISTNVSWLDFTHALTFGHAVRTQCQRLPSQWPMGLAQMACFAGRNSPFTLDEVDIVGWRVSDHAAFFANTIEALPDHDRDEFIVSAHLLKTVLAARAEVRAGLPGDVAELVVAAVNRFVHSPLRLKHVMRTVHQARKFVSLDG